MNLHIVLVLSLVLVWIGGCGPKIKKEDESAIQPEQVLSENETVITNEMLSDPAALDPAAQMGVIAPEMELAVDPSLAAVGVHNPTADQIQEALKNAGFYQGPVDGKIGPKSKRAIREFQIKNNLAVDGKVGPKTWAKLGPYLASQESMPVAATDIPPVDSY